MSLPEAERKRRQEIVASTTGTQRADGRNTDAATRLIMDRWAAGEITLKELGTQMEAHVRTLAANFKARQDAGEVFPPSEGDYIAHEGELQEVVFPNGVRRWVPVTSGNPIE